MTGSQRESRLRLRRLELLQEVRNTVENPLLTNKTGAVSDAIASALLGEDEPDRPGTRMLYRAIRNMMRATGHLPSLDVPTPTVENINDLFNTQP